MVGYIDLADVVRRLFTGKLSKLVNILRKMGAGSHGQTDLYVSYRYRKEEARINCGAGLELKVSV